MKRKAVEEVADTNSASKEPKVAAPVKEEDKVSSLFGDYASDDGDGSNSDA